MFTGFLKVIVSNLGDLAHSIFHGLAETKLYGGLCRDLDNRTGSRISSFSCLSSSFDQLSESGNSELTVLLYFFSSKLCEGIKKSLNVFFAHAACFSHAVDDLRLCHTSHNID